MKKQITFVSILLSSLISKALAFDANVEQLRADTLPQSVNNIADGGGTCLMGKPMATTVDQLKVQMNNASVTDRQQIREQLIQLLNETENQ